MLRARFSTLALTALAAIPAMAQITSSPSPIPNGLGPLSPVVPLTPQVSVNPPLNTATPVGSIGVGGTTSQLMPNPVNPTGGASMPATSSSLSTATPTGIGIPNSVTPATASTVPGYTAPGTANMTGYTSPPGTIAFPSVNPLISPGLSTTTVNSGTGSMGSGATGVLRTSP